MSGSVARLACSVGCVLGMWSLSASAAAQQNARPPHDARWFALAADSAFRHGDRTAYLRLSLQARQLAPHHPSTLYYLARAYAANGLRDPALVLLEHMARMGDTRRVEDDTVFRALHGDPAFRRVVAQLARNRQPVISSDTAFVLPDPDLLPEALAFNARDSSFFVGSLAKHEVVHVVPGVGVTLWADPGDGLLRVVGMHVDGPRRDLWLATWAPGLDTARASAERVDHARLFRYDATTGRLLRRYTPRGRPVPHALNDLVVTRHGDLYVTDTDADAIYRVRRDADTLELFVRPDPVHFSDPNGIALDTGDRRLYVAFAQGIGTVDLRTRAVAMLDVPPDVTTSSIDGLYFHQSSLIAVQTSPDFTRVMRFDLDSSGRRVVGERVLERGHPAYRWPTTGAVVGDWFYYIANSQWDRLSDDGRLAPDPLHRKTVVLKLPLPLATTTAMHER